MENSGTGSSSSTGLPKPRERKTIMPKKKEAPCPLKEDGSSGCERFTTLGSNHLQRMETCLECGWSKKERVVNTPQFPKDRCPHNDTDNRGSTKTYIYILTANNAVALSIIGRDLKYKT